MSEKIYACLLRLYPANFRQAHGDDALQLFRVRLRDETGFFCRTCTPPRNQNLPKLLSRILQVRLASSSSKYTCDRRLRRACLRRQTSTRQLSTPCHHRESPDQILPAVSSCGFSFPSDRFTLGLH